jgi:hypothetical protein
VLISPAAQIPPIEEDDDDSTSLYLSQGMNAKQLYRAMQGQRRPVRTAALTRSSNASSTPASASPARVGGPGSTAAPR